MNISNKKVLHAGFLSVSTITAEVSDPRASQGFITKDFELMERADCSSVLLHDEKGNVAILKQFRPGAIEHDNGADVMELAAGMIEAGQTPYEAALREVEEETGATPESVELTAIGTYYLTPGGSNERTHLYLGRTDLSLIDTNKIHGLESESEVIKVEIMHVTEALALTTPQNITLRTALLELLIAS